MDLRAFITPQLLESIPNLWCYVLVISFLVGSFMGGINMISSTAISREGTNAYFMKFIPVPVETQAFAKAACGIIISAVSGWLLLIPLHLVLSYPIYLDLIFVVGSLVSVIMTNLFGILIDLLRPKLVWEQEAAAVKQNLNGVISILLSFLLAAVCFGLLYIGWDQVLLIAIGLLVIQIVLSFLLYVGVKRAGTRLLSQI